MALNPLRRHRTLTTLTTLHRTLSIPNPTVPAITANGSNSTRTLSPSSSSRTASAFCIFQSRWFRSSGGPLLSQRQYKLYKEGDEITDDTVLFEGCDYNHWLIVVDFPKDNKPPPEEMVRTYEQVCAQGLGVSVEEAKKRIYACSTTTYEGFQVLMSEEESEKFHNVPGVVFVLPDSYLDPVKKEYGGDKYENGVITPRPPPVQFRNQSGRFRQNTRNSDQPRYDRQGSPMQNQQGNPPYNQQGFVQGDGRNYRPPQSYPPQQNYGQQPPVNRDYAPQGSKPSYQGSYKPEEQHYRQGPSPGPGQNYSLGANPGYGQNYGQGGNPGYGQEANRGYGQNFRQGANPGYGQKIQHGTNPSYGQNFGQGANPGYGQNFGQEANPGYGQQGQSYGQGTNPPSGHNYGPGAAAGSGQINPVYGQPYPGHGAGQGFSQVEHRHMQGEPSGSMGQGGMQQGRY